jgi:hypothetical protein
MSVIVVHSEAHEQIIDIAEDVAAAAASLRDGVCGSSFSTRRVP